MIRKIVAVWVSLAMLFGFVVIVDVVTDITPPVKAATITVDDSGGADYLTIQEGIDAANPGDTVSVYNGTYYENVVVNKTINLTGEDKNTTIIDAGGTGDAVKITADWTNITGFTCRNSDTGTGNAAIDIANANNCSVYCNELLDSSSGIYFDHSYDNYINDNRAESNGHGFLLEYSERNTLIDNQAVSNSANGFCLGNSNGNFIIGNNASYSDINYGIRLVSSNENWIAGNFVTFNNGDGIYLAQSISNNIIGNNISSNLQNGIYTLQSAINSIRGNEIHLNGDNGIHLDLSSGANNLTSNNVSMNTEGGIVITVSSDNILMNNNVSQNANGGLYLYLSEGGFVENNHIFSNIGDGINIYDSSNCVIIRNNISSNTGTGMDIYSSSDVVNVTDNSISSNGIHGVSLSGSVGGYFSNNTMIGGGLLISGNSVGDWNTHDIDTSNTVNGKPLYYWKNETEGTIPLGAGEVILANCHNVIVENQAIFNSSVGILLGFSSDNLISNNNISSHTLFGMYLCYSNKNKIINNYASNNKYGMYLIYENDDYISCNTAINNEYGFHFWYSDGIKVVRNTVASNIWYGMRFETSSKNSVIMNNVSKNTYGIVMWSSSDANNVTCNFFYSNKDYGLRIASSTGNRVYHNNFLSDKTQAYDHTANSNKWDNGYPSGGNYWSDYNGTDLNTTPSQDVPPPDGIGDTPYEIDTDSWDNYPLMKPFDKFIILKQGWNLISIPFIQVEQNLTWVLGSIDGNYDAVQWYNNSDPSDPWKHYKPGKPFGNDLTHLNETMGFWIHITNPGDTIFLYNGTQPTSNQSITLHPGWNMVGYPSLINRTRDIALNNINYGSDVDAIWTFNAATQTWQEIGSTDYFELGRGYWIHSKVTKVWDVPL